MSDEWKACSALDADRKCKNGFFVTGACHGSGNSVPICCNEAVCGRIYPNGQPTPTDALKETK